MDELKGVIIDAKKKPSFDLGQFTHPSQAMEWLAKQNIQRTKPTEKEQLKFLATTDDPIAQMAQGLCDTKTGVCFDMAALPALVARKNKRSGGIISTSPKNYRAKHAIAWWAEDDGTISVSSNQGFKRSAFTDFDQFENAYKRAFGTKFDAPAQFLDPKGQTFKTEKEESFAIRDVRRTLVPLAEKPIIQAEGGRPRQQQPVIDLDEEIQDRDGIYYTKK